MDFKEHIRVFLSFSKKERRGIYLLLTISMLLWILPVFFTEEGSLEEVLDITPIQINKAKEILLVKKDSLRLKRKYWNYDRRDVQRNGIDLKPEIRYSKPFYDDRIRQQKPAVLDLNVADSASLERLPGIGERLSARIIKYRDRLGGFHVVDQLKEVYGLRDSLLDQLSTRVSVTDKSQLKKIAVNQASYGDFRKHPYMTHAFAKSLVAYREMHGSIKSADDLYKLVVVTKEEVDRILPYISFEE